MFISDNRNSSEVKRATVVGNPMFSTNTINLANKSAADLAALDDLQLDMDYDQIMHYFDNLKVGSFKIYLFHKFVRTIKKTLSISFLTILY